MLDPKNASVDPNTLWCLLLYTVRYALGRCSSATGDAADWVRRYRSYLTPQQVQQIADEVAAALAACEKKGESHFLGMAIDHKTWRQLVEDLKR